MPELSVVIPTHNRAALLERVLAALARQTLPAERYELIAVDSNSSDHTPEVLKRLAAAQPNLRALRTERPGAAVARNLGLEAARAPLILLLDDDILAPETFLAQVLDCAGRHPGRVLLGQIAAPWEESSDPFHRFLLQSNDVNVYNFADPLNVSASHFYTACAAIPRTVLGSVRLDENFTVYGLEDLDFGLRLLNGTGMVYQPELKVLHEYYPCYREYRRKKLKAGYSLAYFFQKSPENARHFYIEPTRVRLAFRLCRLALAPLAGAVYIWERIVRRKGPVHPLLYAWFYRDLRVQLFTGMRRFHAGRPAPR